MKSLKKLCKKTKLKLYVTLTDYYMVKTILLAKYGLLMIKLYRPIEEVELNLVKCKKAAAKEKHWNHCANAELEELMILES